MKKAYIAPEILFESFTPSTNIAGDCGVIVNTATENVCAYETRTGLSVFTSDLVACTTHEADGAFNNLCYHVPYDNTSLFNS